MNVLSEPRLNEFSNDALVWILLDKANSDIYFRIPVNAKGDLEIVAFTEKEDAEQTINLLKTFDRYKNSNIGINAELLTNVRAGAGTYEQELCVLDHEFALKFFTDFLKFPV